jgi:mono/diheme cytochrome c family protein/uncharacterized membrane protein
MLPHYTHSPTVECFMKSIRPQTLAIGCVLTLSLGRAISAEELGPIGLQSRVRSIFVAKCSECHGRGLSRPRAALYLHELGPLAANRAWVVPYEPEKSYLWTLIRDDDMPAKGARAGPLNAQEKELVRAWIAAGAPAPPPAAGPPQESPGTVPTAPLLIKPSLTMRLFAWLGKLHVLVVHFPIAFMAAAALAELMATWQGSRVPSPEVYFCVLLGAAGAVAAVALGWLHTEMGNFSSSLLAMHRRLGSAAGLWAMTSAVLCERDRRGGRRSLLFRLILWTGACVVAATAHFGGLMVQGDRFFDF